MVSGSSLRLLAVGFEIESDVANHGIRKLDLGGKVGIEVGGGGGVACGNGQHDFIVCGIWLVDRHVLAWDRTAL